ncbi:MAG: GatB/YqeY domain-containing protein, partial [Chloroflexia bacterium]
MTIKEQIIKDLQDAMRSGDALRKETLRMTRSAIRNAEMARSAHILDLAALGDAAAQTQKLTQVELNTYTEVKRRRKLAEEYEAADNMEMAAKERDAIGELVERYSLLDEAGIEDVLRKEIKQRRESVESFEHAKRMDLADKERAEAAILEAYLPTQMTEDQIEVEVR